MIDKLSIARGIIPADRIPQSRFDIMGEGKTSPFLFGWEDAMENVSVDSSVEGLQELSIDERFAYLHADQYLGCISCKESHHVTAFCRTPKCCACFFKGEIFNEEIGDFVKCYRCKKTDLWD